MLTVFGCLICLGPLAIPVVTERARSTLSEPHTFNQMSSRSQNKQGTKLKTRFVTRKTSVSNARKIDCFQRKLIGFCVFI